MRDTEDDLLYHYTGGAALTSIVGDECLWASDPLFLNDAAELRSGKERLIEHLNPALALLDDELVKPGKVTLESLFAGFHAAAIEDVINFINAVDAYSSDVAHIYVTCFCKDGDLLSQWRSYGRGGYAIGYARGELAKIDPKGAPRPERLDRDSTTWCQLIKVAYEGADITDRIIASELLSSFVENKPYYHTSAHWKALETLASIKDAGFKEEQEWRLVYVRPANPIIEPHEKYREGAASLVPYIELQAPSSAIRKIIIGPGGDAHLREMGVRRLFERYGLYPEVVQSKVPYRAASGS